MRDTNEDSNSSSWPLFYGDKTLTNGHYCNGFIPRTVTDAYPGYDKDALKNKMLEHEAVFKSQVYELHRLYRRQRDMMEEVRRKELHKHRISIDTSSSSSLLPSQIPSEDARKWQIPSFPLANSNCGRPSLFGAEIIDSPLSCTKGSSSKDCEVLECRPLKVRKKLFDLQLPADEYIDDTEEGEQVQDNKTYDASSYPFNGNNGITDKNGVKLFLGGGGQKADCFGDASSDQCLRGLSGLADLNEPIHVEEANAPAASVDFLGHSACGGEFRGVDLSAKPTSKFLGFPHEHFQKSQNGISKGAFNDLSIENKSNGREWLSHVREAGNSKSDVNFTSPFLQPEKLPLPSDLMQHMRGKDQRTPGIFPVDHSRVDSWRERVGGGSEAFEKIPDHSNYNHHVPVVPSHMSSSYPFVNSSDMAKTWPHSVSSWGKPSSSLTHKLTSVQPHPSYPSSGTLCRSSLSSPQSHEIFGDKWFANGTSRLNIGSGSDFPTRNGFYHGSSSGSKELSARLPSSFDSLNCNKGDNVGPEHLFNQGSQKLFKGSDFTDLRSVKDMNLNLNMVQNLLTEEASQQGLGILDEKKKCEDHGSLLPWLRTKLVSKNDALPNQLINNGTQNFTSNNHHHVGAKATDDSSGNKKLLGFPIFGNPSISKNDSSSLVSTSASLCCPPEGENMQKEMKHRAIDINVAYDSTFCETDKQIDAEALAVEKEMDMKVNSFKNQFDLNSCLTEDEDLPTQSVKSTSANVTIRVEIDLEAPAIPDLEEAIPCGADHHDQPQAPLRSPQHKAEHQEDEELAKVAAEAIVAISVSDQPHVEGPTSEEVVTMDDPLLWFVEVVSSCMDNLDKKSENSSSDKIDDFEAMTLQLEETKEEEYMPVPFLPEIQEAEEAGSNSLPNRPRRGQARRGRPRRDFQRDILPGLTSLSRHEVTEDLQIFGGLMRATGHAWNSGLTRRNGTRGGGRGRRRTVVEPPPPLMEQINNIEVGLEERSLTAGWAKTPRRPRRQRCPAGNSVAVPLT